ATLTGAGIADRNVSYRQLIDRREQRRSAEIEAEKPEPDRIHAAVAALREDQHRLMRDSIDLVLREGSSASIFSEPDAAAELSNADATARMLAHLTELAAMTPEDVAAEQAKVSAQLTALEEVQQAAERGRWQAAPPATPSAPPGPSQPVPALSPPVNRGLHVVTDAEAEDFADQRNLWHRIA
ncbi:MAG: hypothetical protein M3O93_07380, partial [Chloroflexota bacterium]|nr:hypothetical protein [Chloroflexota bacterium]